MNPSGGQRIGLLPITLYRFQLVKRVQTQVENGKLLMFPIMKYNIKENNNTARVAVRVIHFWVLFLSVVFGAGQLWHLSPASQAQTGSWLR